MFYSNGSVFPVGDLYLGDMLFGDRLATTAEVAAWELLRNPLPTPDDLKAEILDALEDRPTRLQLKLVIQLSELTAASMAASHGLTVPQAIAYAYSKNSTYRRAKDAEAACMAIDSGAI